MQFGDLTWYKLQLYNTAKKMSSMINLYHSKHCAIAVILLI